MARFVKAITLFMIMMLLASVSPPMGTAHADAAGDRDALVALYNATGGENWTNNGNWLSDGPLDDWHGVTADSSGRVVRLSLSFNELTGPIPGELGGLSNLESLSLSSNRLTGPIPGELGSLSNLESLYLSFNELTGIPS